MTGEFIYVAQGDFNPMAACMCEMDSTLNELSIGEKTYTYLTNFTFPIHL